MKTPWTIVLLLMLFWCSPVFAEYCTVNAEGKERSCVFKVDRIPHNTQIVISYTQQGWTMMIALFQKEFAMIEGDSTVITKPHGDFDLKHVTTRRDVTHQGKMMEAPIYQVSEEALHAFGDSKGKLRFWLAATEARKNKVEVEVAASTFSDIDAYIEETKTVLGVLFQDQ